MPESKLAGGTRFVYYGRGTDCVGVMVAAVELIGGSGAAIPAVSDPNPNCCKVRASILPVGFKPCAA